MARTAVNIAEAYAEVLVDSLTEELDASARLLARVEDPDRIVELFGLSAAEILALQDFTFCSTQVNIEDPLKTALLTYGSLIPDDAIVEDGREDEPHITVKYGLHDDDPAAMTALLAGERPVRWRLGPTSIFTTPDADVLKIGVTSSDLHRLNRRISENVDVTDTYPEYVPHVTIAYLQPGLGARFAGDATFDGLEGVSDTVLFSNRDGIHTPILLTGRAIKAASTRPILNAADAHRAALKKAIITAFHAGRGKITKDQIKQALVSMRGAEAAGHDFHGNQWTSKAAAEKYGAIDHDAIQRAVIQYKNYGHVDINQFMRSGKTDSAETKATAKALEAGFHHKDTVKYATKDTWVYRGIDDERVRRSLAQRGVGDVITDKAFLSTSFKDTIAGHASSAQGVMFEIKVPKGTPYLSGHRGDQEMLLAPRTKLKIDDFYKEKHFGTIPGEWRITAHVVK